MSTTRLIEATSFWNNVRLVAYLLGRPHSPHAFDITSSFAHPYKRQERRSAFIMSASLLHVVSQDGCIVAF